MKKILSKLYVVFILFSLAFASCNKNDKNFDYRKASPSVELPIAAHAGPTMFDNGGFKYAIVDSIINTPQALNTTVLLSAPNPLKNAVTVTLTVDNSVVTKLNAAHKALYLADSTAAVKDGTDLPDATATKYAIYVALPGPAYTVPGNTVTIAAGQLTANYVINIITTKLTYGVNYMLPVTITDGGGQDINYYKSVYYIIGLKNQYDGNYLADGSLSFPDPSSNRSWSARAKSLTTVGLTSVRAEAADLGGSSYYMNLSVNPDNTVTVTSTPDAANQTIQNDGICIYDPTTKTFTLNYKYIGGTGDRVISETLKRN
jgi:hypothetical protein